ncbi:MAG TPA: DUF6370 family protein [Vicinamibacterales bacterium]|jgi:hypothetical protein
MKTFTLFSLAAVLVIGLVAAAAAADETTLTGSIMCAKCALKKADAKTCQDVLVVKDQDGTTKEYYVTKNAVSEKFGHTCSGEKPAVVTGAVAEKDGKTWVTPTKMEEKKG